MIARQGNSGCRSRSAGGQATRCLGDDLEAARHGIECPPVGLEGIEPTWSPQNSCASRALSANIEEGEAVSFSEGIQGISLSAGPNECLKAAAIRYIHAVGEQVGNILGDADILEHADRRVGLDLDHDVDVAGRASASPRATEPNSAACRTPRLRSSCSLARKVAMICSRFMYQYIDDARSKTPAFQ